jgi:exodeoxyribonuclease-3
MSEDMLKVATYNANSIRSRLELVLDWLLREAPDVVCLQETKVQDADFPSTPFQDAGYHVVFRGQKAHAGVAIVSREEPQEVAFGLDDGGPSTALRPFDRAPLGYARDRQGRRSSGQSEPDEPRLIRAVIAGVPVVNTYVPQGRSPDSEHFQYKLEWLARLGAFFERHYSPQEPLLWMGDFNVAPELIDVHDPKRLKNHVDFHPEARAALERVRRWGFSDVFRLHHPDEPGQYTFWDYRVRDALERGLGWRVDHIWATEPLAQKSTRAWIDVEARRAERPSDHTFLVAEFAL